MECAIRLDGVCYSYDSDEGEQKLAVKDVTIDIKKGSFVAIVGHNGSGKSTLARMLNGLLIPTAGRVKVFGYDTCDEDSIYEVRRRVGMVFQNPDNQMVASIVEDDIAFGPENLGVEREEIIRRVDNALESVGMSQYRKSMPFRMSGGQKQRIAIAGALALCPEVLVLDESTAMLDPKGRNEVMGVIRKLNREQGMTVIHITHYMEETLDCDRVIVMNDGAVAIDGTPAEVFGRGDELRRYKISPPYVTWLACALANVGLNVDRNIYTEERLEESLCRLLSKD